MTRLLQLRPTPAVTGCPAQPCSRSPGPSKAPTPRSPDSSASARSALPISLPQLVGAARAPRSCAPSVFPLFGLRPNGEDGRFPPEGFAQAITSGSPSKWTADLIALAAPRTLAGPQAREPRIQRAKPRSGPRRARAAGGDRARAGSARSVAPVIGLSHRSRASSSPLFGPTLLTRRASRSGPRSVDSCRDHRQMVVPRPPSRVTRVAPADRRPCLAQPSVLCPRATN